MKPASITVRFYRRQLEETVLLLRSVAKATGAPVEEASIAENVREALALVDVIGDTRSLFEVKGSLVTTEGTNETETWVVLQPTDVLRERSAAVGIGAL